MRLLLVLFLFVPFLVYAQGNDTVSAEVKEVWELIREHSFEKERKIVEKTKDELKPLIKKLCNAIEKDPFGFHNYWKSGHEKYIRSLKPSEQMNHPAKQYYELRSEIDKAYGQNFSAIIFMPFYVKITITKLDSIVTFYKHARKFLMNAITGRVDEVIRGEYFIKVGDTINILYSPEWFMEPGDWVRIKEGMTCFVPMCVYADNPNFYLTSFNDKIGLFPIINGNIEDENNSFGLGKITSWSQFKDNFTNKFTFRILGL
ncbi:MAG: hypothetical protein ACM3MI_11600 [Clostridiales bacterium]